MGKKRTKSAFDRLQPDDKVFVRSYLTHFNASQAARDCGYKGNRADESGARRVRKSGVKAAISELLEVRGITPERIKTELAGMVFGSDVADFEPYLAGESTFLDMRQDGVNTTLVHKAKTRVIERDHGKDKTTTITTREVELYDRLAAMRELNRVLGIITERRQIDGVVKHEHGLSDDRLGDLCNAVIARCAEGAGG